MPESRERIKVIACEPERGGFRLTLDCWHLYGYPVEKVQHTTWRKKPVKYVLHCEACEYQEELWADYWSNVL